MRTEEQVLIAMFEALIPWYEAHKRELPWRQDREPYHVWLSEIMLQQTRVEAVKGYYDRFLKALPTVKDLAEAEEGSGGGTGGTDLKALGRTWIL